MIKFTINHTLEGWIPCISSEIEVLRVWPAMRLIEALEIAQTLQMHVANAGELPINQYYKGE